MAKHELAGSLYLNSSFLGWKNPHWNNHYPTFAFEFLKGTYSRH